MITIEEVNQLIRTRRSVFASQFEEGKIIPDEVIMDILENANTAPTHKKTEPWRFRVFTGEGLKKLGLDQAEIYKNEAGDSFKEARYESLKTAPLKSSHVIAICMKASGSVPEMEEVAAVACAVQNIYLSLAVHGVGGYWSTGGITFMEGAKPYFGLENNDKLLGFFFLGYTKIPSATRTPGPLEDKIEWIRG